MGEGAAFNLEAGDDPYVIITTGTATGGYDAIRPHGPFFMQSLTDQIERIVTARAYDG